MGGLLGGGGGGGGGKGYVGRPPLKLLGGPGPPSSYAYGILIGVLPWCTAASLLDNETP